MVGRVDDAVGDAVGDAAGDAAGAISESERQERREFSLEFKLWKLTNENIALRAQVEVLRECLGLFGRRRSGHRGGDYGRYERSASRSPPRDHYDDPFASQRMSSGY